MGIFGGKKDVMPDWAIRSSVFMTIAQALSVGRQTPASAFVPGYSKLFSAIVSKGLKDGLISEEIFQAIEYSPFQIQISRDDFELFKVTAADSPVYLQQGIAINRVLSNWNNSMSITNADQNDIFTALSTECKTFGMGENDEETIGLLFLVSIFYTTLLKDSQADKVNCDNWRSIGSFFATELPNRWLIESSRQ